MADNSAFYAKLDAFTDRLRQCESLDEDAAKECAAALHAKVRSNVAAQVDPYGHAWPPGKQGQPVLVNAANAVTSEANGTTITMAVTGPEAMHHVGSARGYHGGSAKLGGYRRPLIPWKSLPGPMKAVIREVLAKRFNRIFGGA